MKYSNKIKLILILCGHLGSLNATMGGGKNISISTSINNNEVLGIEKSIKKSTKKPNKEYFKNYAKNYAEKNVYYKRNSYGKLIKEILSAHFPKFQTTIPDPSHLVEALDAIKEVFFFFLGIKILGVKYLEELKKHIATEDPNTKMRSLKRAFKDLCNEGKQIKDKKEKDKKKQFFIETTLKFLLELEIDLKTIKDNLEYIDSYNKETLFSLFNRLDTNTFRLPQMRLEINRVIKKIVEKITETSKELQLKNVNVLHKVPPQTPHNFLKEPSSEGICSFNSNFNIPHTD